MQDKGEELDTHVNSEARSGRSRRWYSKLLAALISCLLAAGVIEVAFRIFPSLLLTQNEIKVLQDPRSIGELFRRDCLANPSQWLKSHGDNGPTIYRVDAARGFALKEGISKTIELDPPGDWTYGVETDDRGLRKTHERVSSNNVTKILALGDSMTFGVGVENEETWPAKLEQYLNQSRLSSSLACAVFNGGVVSYGQDEEFQTARQYLPDLKPSLVILCFTIANDVIDNLRWEDRAVPFKERTDSFPLFENHPAIDNFLASHSKLYRAMLWRWGRHLVRYELMARPDLLEHSVGKIKKIKTLVESHQGRLCVVLAPSIAQVEGGLAEFLARTRRVNRGISQRLQLEDIPCFDPLEDMRRDYLNSGESLFIPVDRHWTRRGHEVVAASMQEFVRKQLVK